MLYEWYTHVQLRGTYTSNSVQVYVISCFLGLSNEVCQLKGSSPFYLTNALGQGSSFTEWLKVWASKLYSLQFEWLPNDYCVTFHKD